MNHTPHILVCGNYGATNLGDEAILQSILQYIRNSYPHAHIKVVTADPRLTAKQYGVETVAKIPAGFRSFLRSIFSKSFRKTLRAYKQADAIIFGGGGLFSDEKPRAIIIWTMQILPALWYKKPVFCLGQSIGPLFMRTSRWTVQYLFKKMRIVTVRDEASKNLLEKLGILNVQFLPDPVFGLQIDKKEHINHHHSRQPYIVFSLRPWLKNSEKHHMILAEFIDWLFINYHLKTYFVPFQSSHDDDTQEVLKVFSKLEHREAAEIFSFNENIGDVAKLMEKSTAVLGMRLHSLILAAITKTPFLGLSYSLKVTEAVRQLGMGKYFCEYRSLDLETLKKKFELLFTYRERVEKDLQEKHRELEEKTQGYSLLLKNLFNRELE